MKNRCYNCKWFFSCKRSDKDPAKKDCEYFEITNVKEVKNGS